MKLAVVGTGAMGAAIGSCWAEAGHDVYFSFTRDPKRLKRLAKDLGGIASSVAEALASADAILLSVRWAQVHQALDEMGDLGGRVLMDCTLPMKPDDTGLAIGHTNSGAEEIQRLTGSKVVKAFNTIPSEFIAARRSDLTEGPDVIIASDDAGAKAVTAGLVRDAGFEPVDAGNLICARYMEPLAVLMGQLAYVQGSDPRIGYRVVRMAAS